MACKVAERNLQGNLFLEEKIIEEHYEHYQAKLTSLPGNKTGRDARECKGEMKFLKKKKKLEVHLKNLFYCFATETNVLCK